MNWSNQGLKLTMGCGSLAQTAILADVLGPVFSVWGLIALVIMPLTIVAMIKIGDEIPARLIQFAHGVSVVWYVVLSAATVGFMALRGFEPTDVLMGFMLALGLLPCVAIVRGMRRGDYDGEVVTVDDR